jgi:hypothetical protein
MLVLLLAVLAGSFLPEPALAKRVAMGLPSLSVTLHAGYDEIWSDVIIEDERAVETLKANVGKVNAIFDTIILPEIRKEFDERRDIYTGSYVETIGGNYDLKGSRLVILINKVPPDYGCSAESCAHRTVTIGVPAELELSYIRQMGFGIAVTENMGGGGEYDMFVDRVLAKASNEAKTLFSEASNVLQDNRERLLEDDTAVEILLLRQYEDISRISVLFASLDPEASCADYCKKPLDVVVTSNSYYEQSWNRSQQSEQKQPTAEMLQECEEIGIAEQDCDEVSILQSRVHQVPLSEEEREILAEQQNQIGNAMYMIGIGAAIAGIVTFLTLRKTQ